MTVFKPGSFRYAKYDEQGIGVDDPNGTVATPGAVPGDGNLTGGVNADFAVIGDSIMQDALVRQTFPAYSSLTWTQWGVVAWLRRLLGDAVRFGGENFFAVAGHTLEQIRTIQVPQLIASGRSRVLMDGGINSVTRTVPSVLSLAEMVAEYQQIFDACYSAGIFVDYLTIRVCDSGNITSDQAKRAAYLNAWVKQYAAARPLRMKVHDWNEVYLDPATGFAKAGYLRDGKHDSTVGAWAAGVWLAPRLGVKAMPVVGGAGDAFDATNNPLGNAVTNPRMTGTGGGKSNGVTGTAPDGYNVYRTTNSGTVTAAVSVEADDTIAGINRTVITFGGTADGNMVQLQQTQVVPGNYQVGDVVRVLLLLDVNIPAGYQDLAVNVTARDGSYNKYGESWNGVWVAANGALPAINQTNMVLVSEPMTLGAGTTVLDFFVRVQTPTSGALSGTVKVKAVSISKVAA